VTHEELDGVLLPLILRMAKRSPDAVLGSAARVLALLRLDLGQHAAPVVADLQPLLRHVKPPTRCAPSAARRRTHAPRAPRASLCSAQVGRGGRGGGAGGAERYYRVGLDEGTGAASLHLAGPVCSTLQCRLPA